MMKFTVPTIKLHKLLKHVYPGSVAKKDTMKVIIADGRLIFQSRHGIGSIQIAADGSGSTGFFAKMFQELLSTYKGTATIEMEVGAKGLRFNTFRMADHWTEGAQAPNYTITDLD